MAIPSKGEGPEVCVGPLSDATCSPVGILVSDLLLFFLNFLTVPHGTWDLNSLTRDQTSAPCIRRKES